jgi:hypothetical protein
MIGLVNLAPACELYYILVAGAYRDPISLVALVASIVVLSLPIWAVHTPYLAESFRTEIRSSGYGISYSLATILPGLYSLYMLGLSQADALRVRPDRASGARRRSAQYRRTRRPQGRGPSPRGARLLACRVRQVHRRRYREMRQSHPGGQHQSGVGLIRRRLCCDATAVSGRGQNEPSKHVRSGGSFRRKRSWSTASAANSDRQQHTSIASSRVRSPPTYRCRRRSNTDPPSTSSGHASQQGRNQAESV